MIDIHTHILPGLDDGAQSMEQSLAMFRIAKQEGIHTMIVTPHAMPHGKYSVRGQEKGASVRQIRECMKMVQKRLKEEGIDISLYEGNEIYYRQGVENELAEQRVCTLAGSFYVLVEFHPQEDYAYIMRALNSLVCAGYYPILAHAERYDNLYATAKRVEEIKNSGVMIQINAASVCGKKWTDPYRKRAWMLLKKGLADYVATDAHSEKHRSPRIRECEKLLSRKLGKEYTQKLLEKNAECILTKKAEQEIYEV